MYAFKNIRFAASTAGKGRFAKPSLPEPVEGVQTNSKGGTCPQTIPKSMLSTIVGDSLGSAASALLGTQDMGVLQGGGPSSEDCLFLDVYVPAKALNGGPKLPVINWIYGGAYILGQKETYKGDAIVKASNGTVIYVGGNYRLGAYGFLAGATVEKDSTVVPNAAFYDQRFLLEWIQKYIVGFPARHHNLANL
jgi:carboxylesterase type B